MAVYREEVGPLMENSTLEQYMNFYNNIKAYAMKIHAMKKNLPCNKNNVLVACSH